MPDAVVPHLVRILKRNPLKHLDLSGCFTKAKQLKPLIKKISKHRSLLVVHLSHTSVLRSDKALLEYMHKKLRLIENTPLPKIDRKKSYENTLALRKLQRTMRYFKSQSSEYIEDCER